MSAKIESYPLSRVEVCPLNPRKRINPADIEEMAESILEHGIIQPPIARPREKRLIDEFDGPGAEIVFGQRRFLGAQRALELGRQQGLDAARLKELEEIALIIRPMDDRQVIEEAWVENLQRVDVSVREEADGFAKLLQLKDDQGAPIYTQASLAKKLGKSVAFLSQRLKLQHVPEMLWGALESRRISIRHLELVGTIADPKAREAAAKKILEEDYKGDVLSARATAKLIEEEFRKSLRGVAWDTKDEDLVPVKTDAEGNRISGGSCEDCPFRTGMVPELKDQLAQPVGGSERGQKSGFDARVCLQPSCAKAKEEAHWKRLKAAAESGGARVLTDEEAKKTFREWGDGTQTEPESPLVALLARPDYRATGHYGQENLPTWEALLEGSEIEKDIVIGKHPKTGAVLRLIDRERAIKLAEVGMKERGEVSLFADRPAPAKKTAAGKDKGPQPLSEWQVNHQAKETSERAILLKVREIVTQADGLSTEQLAELVTGVLLESLLEYDQDEDLRAFLELAGFSMPNEEAWRDLDLKDRLKEARFAIGEDLDGVGKTKGWTHVDAWLTILLLLASYQAMESPSGVAFLKGLGIDAPAMRETARAQILQADAERVKREKEALEAREAAKKGQKEPAKGAKTAKKAPKTAKKTAETAKKTAKKGSKPAAKKAAGKGKAPQ